MKKLLIAILAGLLLVSITGCGEKKEDKEKESDTKTEEKTNKENEQNEKEIVCTGKPESTSESEVELKQSFIFRFKDDEATTFDMIQNMKLLKDTEENRKQLTSQTEEEYKNSMKSMYEYMKLEVPDFDVKVKDVSDIEREVTMTFNYKDFVALYASEEEASKYSSFNDIKEHIDEFAGNMTCTYDGKEIYSK